MVPSELANAPVVCLRNDQRLLLGRPAPPAPCPYEHLDPANRSRLLAASRCAIWRRCRQRRFACCACSFQSSACNTHLSRCAVISLRLASRIDAFCSAKIARWSTCCKTSSPPMPLWSSASSFVPAATGDSNPAARSVRAVLMERGASSQRNCDEDFAVLDRDQNEKPPISSLCQLPPAADMASKPPC